MVECKINDWLNFKGEHSFETEFWKNSNLMYRVLCIQMASRKYAGDILLHIEPRQSSLFLLGICVARTERSGSCGTKLSFRRAKYVMSTCILAGIFLKSRDTLDTVAFVHGPQGSGKSHMLSNLLDRLERKALIIDVSELLKANSEVKLVSSLAHQTGYWPVFSFMNSLNNLIDMASQGLIGQKGLIDFRPLILT